MRFKAARLTAIRNEPKWIISTSGRLKLLQMVSEPDTKWCAREDASPPRRVDCRDLTSIGEGNETFLIRA